MLEKASVSLRRWRTMKLLLVLTRKNYHNLNPWKLLGCRNLGTIKCRQPYLHRIGILTQMEAEILVNSNSEPYNIPEAEDYDPNERENVMYDIAVYSSSFGSGEIPVFSDDMWHTLEIMDESSLDGEVGKRLNQMIPIPVSLCCLKKCLIGFVFFQFCSLSDQLYRSPEYHKHVREQIVQQLKSYPELYEGYVPRNDMALLMLSWFTDIRNGEWGDHVTLQAAADWSVFFICLMDCIGCLFYWIHVKHSLYLLEAILAVSFSIFVFSSISSLTPSLPSSHRPATVAVATSESCLYRTTIVAAATGLASCLSRAILSRRRCSTMLLPFSRVSPSNRAMSPCVLIAQFAFF
ncbi:hypothetical protein AHAS_Ahas19G0291600 [Arachis hypogaea]